MRTLLVLLAALFMISCLASPPVTAPEEGDAAARPSTLAPLVFQVLPDRVDTTYEYKDLEKRVDALRAAPIATFTDADIERAEIEPSPACRMVFTLSRSASARNREALLDGTLRPFIVSFGKQRLFVGVLYLKQGAAALRTPVLHVEEGAEGRLVLELGCVQGASWPWVQISEEERRRIDRPEIRAVFQARGILGVLAPRGM